MLLTRLCGVSLATVAAIAIAATPYEFCVTHLRADATESFRVRLGHGDIDPGREGAAVLLARHVRQAPGDQVRIQGFDDPSCSASPSKDLVLTASPQDVANLWAGGDGPGVPQVARQATALASGVYVGVARQAGRALTSASEAANRMVCGLIRC